jgi:hypothetical protein
MQQQQQPLYLAVLLAVMTISDFDAHISLLERYETDPVCSAFSAECTNKQQQPRC